MAKKQTNLNRFIKVKKQKRSYTRVKEGKTEIVKAHAQSYNTKPQLTKQQLKRIKEEGAKIPDWAKGKCLHVLPDHFVEKENSQKKESGLKCDFCGATKKEKSFFIGASNKPDWTMVEGTGKITCPSCYSKAMKEGQAKIKGLMKSSKEEKESESDSFKDIIETLKESMDGAEEEAFKGLKELVFAPKVNKFFTKAEIDDYIKYASDLYGEERVNEMIKSAKKKTSEIDDSHDLLFKMEDIGMVSQSYEGDYDFDDLEEIKDRKFRESKSNENKKKALKKERNNLLKERDQKIDIEEQRIKKEIKDEQYSEKVYENLGRITKELAEVYKLYPDQQKFNKIKELNQKMTKYSKHNKESNGYLIPPLYTNEMIKIYDNLGLTEEANIAYRYQQKNIKDVLDVPRKRIVKKYLGMFNELYDKHGVPNPTKEQSGWIPNPSEFIEEQSKVHKHLDYHELPRNLRNTLEGIKDREFHLSHDAYEEDTKKNAVWHGKITKGYLEWKKKREKSFD